jgi:hypothetical protein
MTYPRGQPKLATHKECAHFSDGFCTLNDVAVGPDQAACPNFTPRSILRTPQTAKPYQQPRQLPQVSSLFRQSFPVSPSYSQNYPHETAPYLGRSYTMPQRGYSFPKQGRAGIYCMSSSRGGGRGRSGGGGGRGRGRGRMGGFAAGPGGSCVCPKCGYTTPHRLGSPCFQQTCPKCGTRMTRKQ